MNILVTGGNGQLGMSLRLASAESSNRYIFTDIEELDITSAEAVEAFVRGEEIDVVVNCAAYTAVDMAEEQEEVADRINHRAVAILAKACAQHKTTLIHISTDYIFSGNASTPYTEEDMPAPHSAYGRTKLAGERAIEASGCRNIILRTAWLYSEFGRNFVKTIRNLLSTRDGIKVVNDQIGTPTYAGDLAEAIVAIIDGGQLHKCGTYNYSNLGESSWYDFAVEIGKMSGYKGCTISPCTTAEYPTKAQRPRYSVLDKSKFIDTFGLVIPEWKASLARCIERLNKS